MKIYFLENWSKEAAQIIHHCIELLLIKQDKCSVLLTGGRSAHALYREWALLPAFKNLRNVNFYLGDERCVPPNHAESNFLMIMQSLFANGVPEGCTFNSLEADVLDLNKEIERYQKLLPDYIDVALFGIGDDGHIASIFPDSPILDGSESRLALTKGIKPAVFRLTITPKVISACHNIFALAPGNKKAQICNSILYPSLKESYFSIPAKLIRDANWLLNKK